MQGPQVHPSQACPHCSPPHVSWVGRVWAILAASRWVGISDAQWVCPGELGSWRRPL